MKGIGASPGIAIGKAVIVEKKRPRLTGVILQGEDEVRREVQRFEQAVTLAVTEVKQVIDTLASYDGPTEVLEIQIELLQDEQIIADVFEKITSEHRTANDAVMEVIASAVTTLHNLDDAYLRERAADVEEAGNRILMELDPTLKPSDLIVGENTVLVGEDITPMDILSVDISKVIGLVTRTGGKTSHAAIVAKARGIPAVVGCGDALASVKNDDTLIVDGDEGTLLVNPTPEMLNEYTAKKKAFTNQANALSALKDTVAVTTDGVRVRLMANISHAEDLEASFAFGAEGSGLLRTELLFMGRTTLPTEEEQFEFYKSVALQASEKPVVVRTLDIGGDKPLPYLHLPAEQNPFLGYRAIRICLDRKDIFITQLRAILRASVFGDLKIMFPMISNVSEIAQAKAILEDVKTALRSTATPFNAAIEVGIMIEIPSAAVMADLLARDVDFFSIGTNDLCQYTLAVDRMNEHVKHLYDPFNPGVLRLIQNVIDQGNKHQRHTGMCGEMAGDVTATLLLLGMGLREFSMSAASIPYVKKLILNTSVTAAQEICRTVMAMRSSAEITQYLQEVTKR